MAVCLECNQGVGGVQELGVRDDLQGQGYQSSSCSVHAPRALPRPEVKAGSAGPPLLQEAPHGRSPQQTREGCGSLGHRGLPLPGSPELDAARCWCSQQ